MKKADKAELLQIEKALTEISIQLWNLAKKNQVKDLGFQAVQTLGNNCYNNASLLGAVVANSERKSK